MVTKIGRKLVQGAKAEIEENPPAILNPDRIPDLVEAAISLVSLALIIFGALKTKGVTTSTGTTTVINNIYINGIKQ